MTAVDDHTSRSNKRNKTPTKSTIAASNRNRLKRSVLVHIRSNLWGTRFRFCGVSRHLPSFTGQIVYKTSLFHLQPRQMTIKLHDLTNHNNLKQTKQPLTSAARRKAAAHASINHSNTPVSTSTNATFPVKRTTTSNTTLKQRLSQMYNSSTSASTIAAVAASGLPRSASSSAQLSTSFMEPSLLSSSVATNQIASLAVGVASRTTLLDVSFSYRIVELTNIMEI